MQYGKEACQEWRWQARSGKTGVVEKVICNATRVGREDPFILQGSRIRE